MPRWRHVREGWIYGGSESFRNLDAVRPPLALPGDFVERFTEGAWTLYRVRDVALVRPQTRFRARIWYYQGVLLETGQEIDAYEQWLRRRVPDP